MVSESLDLDDFQANFSAWNNGQDSEIRSWNGKEVTMEQSLQKNYKVLMAFKANVKGWQNNPPPPQGNVNPNGCGLHFGGSWAANNHGGVVHGKVSFNAGKWNGGADAIVNHQGKVNGGIHAGVDF